MLAAPAVAWLLTGCTTVSLPTIPYEAAEVTVVPSLPAYRIQVGDVLQIKLFLNPELNEEVTVRPDGLISTAVAEDVPAYGQTASDLSAELRTRYKDVLRAPRLSVVVHSFAPNRIYVGGEVNNPGEFVTVGPNLTLVQAVARAGGLRLAGARDSIFVIRRGPKDVPQAFRVNYMDAITGRDPRADVRLSQFDIVYVPRTGVFEAYTFFNQYVQQFVPVSWGFSYLVSPLVGGH